MKVGFVNFIVSCEMNTVNFFSGGDTRVAVALFLNYFGKMSGLRNTWIFDKQLVVCSQKAPDSVNYVLKA